MNRVDDGIAEDVVAALSDMCDLAEENSQYKGDYLSHKHGDAEEIAKARAILARIRNEKKS